MASALCCTMEEGRSDSPTLPNARISDATPASKPLLPKAVGSFNSRFTSACTEDLHQLHEIFNSARDDTSTKTSPSRLVRDRTSRPSIISLRSLHRMTSMRSIIRKKFSRESSKTSACKVAERKSKDQALDVGSATLVKHRRDERAPRLQVTKDHLRRNLLTHKKPHEGGYDSDAEVLDDIAKNIGKKTPAKRPSIHEIDWTPSSGSRPTPESSSRTPSNVSLENNVEPYNVQRPHNVSFKAKIAHVFSTPNLLVESASERDQRLHRCHSATLLGLPKPSPISPLRLPSLSSHDRHGTPWSEVMHESLRLSQFSVPSRHEAPKPSETICDDTAELHNAQTSDVIEPACTSTNTSTLALSTSSRKIEIRVQQPTSIATPRASTSFRGTFRENQTPIKEAGLDVKVEKEDDEEVDPRRSVHLYSMRISHHLRSGSLLSWDQLADAPELSTPRCVFRERSLSEQAQFFHLNQQNARHERQTSSSGFASSKVPSRWGRVLAHESEPRGDMASSIYSSRPQSLCDTFGGSMVNLSVTGSGYGGPNLSSTDIQNLRRSNSFPTDNEDTPRPVKVRPIMNLGAHPAISGDALLNVPARLARKNSVAETKQSKFKEEFSPPSPRQRLTPSTSIMKFLNPKRLSLRSQSEASLRHVSCKDGLDGAADGQFMDEKERRQSRSIMSLRAEQHALKKDHDFNSVWGQALKAHHEEKAAMFRPQNRGLAVRGNPFRERNGSFNSPRLGEQDDTTSHKRLSAPLLDPQTWSSPQPSSALNVPRTRHQGDTSQDFSRIFEKQLADDSVGGAWGRYPSHTREDRALDGGRDVETRDFALEAAIRFATNEDEGHDEDLVDPIERNPSPPLAHGQKKRKKKIGTGKMAKSHSMTFARKFISSYYAGIFKSSSSEFRMHGRGHRSSIASGGNLEHPELELLPAVFMSRNTDGAVDQKLRGEKDAGQRRFTTRSDTDIDKKLNAISMSSLRPRRNSSAPNLNVLDKPYNTAESSNHIQDRARVWSTYYENYVPLFPCASTDTSLNLEEFRWPRRASQDSRRASLCMPPRSARHSRRASQLSKGMMRPDSPRPSFVLVGEAEGGEDKSFVSVRRSTMDLVEKFRKQEVTEHERVLSLTKTRGGDIDTGA